MEKSIKNVKSIRGETEFLSKLDESDEANYLYNENEYIVRKKIWEIMYRNWIEEQEEKKMFENGGRKDSSGNPNSLPKKIKTRKTSIALSQDSLNKQSPYEAIKNCNKFGRKVNFSHIKSLFNK